MWCKAATAGLVSLSSVGGVEGGSTVSAPRIISSVSDSNYWCRRLQLSCLLSLAQQLDPTAGKPRGEFLIRTTSKLNIYDGTKMQLGSPGFIPAPSSVKPASWPSQRPAGEGRGPGGMDGLRELHAAVLCITTHSSPMGDPSPVPSCSRGMEVSIYSTEMVTQAKASWIFGMEFFFFFPLQAWHSKIENKLYI